MQNFLSILDLDPDRIAKLLESAARLKRERVKGMKAPTWNALNGKHVSEVLGDELYRQRLPYLHEALTGKTVRFIAPTRHRVHGMRATELVYVPDIAEDGTTRGLIVMGTDFTDRTRMEQLATALMPKLRDLE